MKKIIISLSLFVAFSFGMTLSNHANAYVDGETLLSSCRDKPGSIMRSICLGYMSAIADIMKTEKIGNRKACIDRKMSLTELIKETMSFIEGNRLDRKKPAAQLVTVAFSNKYPCDKK